MNSFLKPIFISIKESFTNFLYDFSNEDGLNRFFRERGWLSEIQSSDVIAVHSVINIKSSIENVLDLIGDIQNSKIDIEDAIPTIKPLVEQLYVDLNF